jgi:two-component SAPR family response regulator
MVMPRMTGTALAERVPSRLSRMKMLFASGYAEYNASEPTVVRAGGHLLQKPYTSAMLARAVRRVLDETKTAPQSVAK